MCMNVVGVKEVPNWEFRETEIIEETKYINISLNI